MQVNIFHTVNRSYWRILIPRKLTREWSCMLLVCQGPIGSIITHSDDTDVLLLSVYYFSRGQLTDHLCLKFWNGALHSRTSYCKRNWPISLWMSPCCATPFGVFSKQKRQEAYSGLVIDMGMLSNLKTFHEYNLADIVNIVHSNALLSDMVRRGETSIHSMSWLHYGHDNRQISNIASPNPRCLQRACHSCQMSYFDLMQKPHPKLRADWTRWSQLVSLRRWTRHSDNTQSAPDEVRDLTHLYCTKIMCGCQEVFLPASRTIMHRCVLLYKLC